MKTIELNGHSVQLYASIKEIPIRLSKEMQKYILQSMGIGSEVQDIDEHLEKIFLFITRNEKDLALEEAKNLRFNLFSIINDLDFKHKAFACLVRSVDGVVVSDYSSEGLGKIIDQLSDYGLTVGQAEDTTEEVKKNLLPNANFTSHNSSAMI